MSTMSDDAITREAMEALLAFLPRFEEPGRAFVTGGGGGEETGDGALTTPYPIYADDVLAFVRLAGSPPWCDHAYDPAAAGAMLRDDRALASASLVEVRAMLTYFIRGERFGDGHWDALLRAGRVSALLRRLRALRDGAR
jgi:hypothetical protein